MLFRKKSKFHKFQQNLDKALKDLEKPSGVFAKGITRAVKVTADFVAQAVTPEFFKDRSGTLSQGLRQNYTVEFPNRIILLDEGKMDKYMNQRNPTKKSKYNPNDYISYWHFIYEGWGLVGGKRSSLYDLRVLVGDRRTHSQYWTSPFNPGIGDYLVRIRTQRHPGKEGRDWYKILQPAYQRIFSKEFEIESRNWLIKMGIQ